MEIINVRWWMDIWKHNFLLMNGHIVLLCVLGMTIWNNVSFAEWTYGYTICYGECI